MKRFAAVFLIPAVFLCCGFRKKPVIILSSNLVTNDTAQVIENTFNSQQKIYYALYSKKGFKKQGIRLQISKQSDKTKKNWGFSIISAKDIYLDKNVNIYRDYIFIQTPGDYIIQFFYLDNKDYPFAHREFKVL